jgi:hypothetical protein
MRPDINLPTCGISFVALLLTLRLNPTRKQTFSQLSKTFDFLGMYVERLSPSRPFTCSSPGR